MQKITVGEDEFYGFRTDKFNPVSGKQTAVVFDYNGQACAVVDVEEDSVKDSPNDVFDADNLLS